MGPSCLAKIYSTYAQPRNCLTLSLFLFTQDTTATSVRFAVDLRCHGALQSAGASPRIRKVCHSPEYVQPARRTVKVAKLISLSLH